MDTEVFDKVKQIRNRCEVILMLQTAYPLEEIRNLLPTLLEDIHEDSQFLVTGYCVED